MSELSGPSRWPRGGRHRPRPAGEPRSPVPEGRRCSSRRTRTEGLRAHGARACTQSLKMNCVTKGNVRGKAGVRTPVAKGELANSLADEDLTETPAQVLHIVVLLQARGAHAQAKLADVVVPLDYADWHRGVVPRFQARQHFCSYQRRVISARPRMGMLFQANGALGSLRKTSAHCLE